MICRPYNAEPQPMLVWNHRFSNTSNGQYKRVGQCNELRDYCLSFVRALFHRFMVDKTTNYRPAIVLRRSADGDVIRVRAFMHWSLESFMRVRL
jgi:hypothetical protein